LSFEHQKKPGSGHAVAAGSPSSQHGDVPGKRTLTEALPHHAPHDGAQLQRKEAGHASHEAGSASHQAGHANHEAGAAHAAHDPEADTSEGGTSLNIALIAGKPAKAGAAAPPARKDPKTSHPAPRAQAAAAPRPLTIAEAINQYAPVVFLAKDEANRPADAGEYIQNSSLGWSHDSGRKDDPIAETGQIDQKRLGSGGYTHQVEGRIRGPHGRQIPSNADVRPKDKTGAGGSEGFFLNVDNAHRASRKSGTDAPVYYEAENHHYITYWFFYAFNDGPTQGKFDGVDDHEGDWERISVRLDGNNRATAVAYYQHEGHTEVPWSKVHTQNGHPVVYSAKGSHASYTRPGPKPIYKTISQSTPLGTVKKRVKIATDQPSAGAQWQTAPHLQNAREQDWYGYGGAWGEVGDTEISTGPQGPSHHKPPAPEGW